MKSSMYRLFYFPTPGRGGAIRAAFRLGNIEFDDVQVSREDFQAKKAEGFWPYDALPVLSVNGRLIAESNAILRFVGKLAGLYPHDSYEAAMVDELVDAMEGCYAFLTPSMREPDLTRRLEMRRELCAKRIPRWLSQLEAAHTRNQGERYMVRDKLSIADLKLYFMLSKLEDGSLDGIPMDVLAPHKVLKSVMRHLEVEHGLRYK